MNAASKTLILSWGNPGRLDDGLGPALADDSTLQGLPDVTIVSDYQLQVENAEQASRYRRVVFVDADRTAPAPFRVERAEPSDTGVRYSSHSVSPGSVLALARDLFRAEPEAWIIGIRGYEFDEFGEGLSEDARANLQAAVEYLRQALRTDIFHEVAP